MSILFKLTSFVNSSLIKPSWHKGCTDWNGTDEYRESGSCIPNWYFDFLSPSNICRIIRNRRVPIELSFISSCVEVLRCVKEFPACVTKIFLGANAEQLFGGHKCSASRSIHMLGIRLGTNHHFRAKLISFLQLRVELRTYLCSPDNVRRSILSLKTYWVRSEMISGQQIWINPQINLFNVACLFMNWHTYQNINICSLEKVPISTMNEQHETQNDTFFG